MDATQRAMFAALDPLSSLALADTLEEQGDIKNAKLMRARAAFGKLFFDMLDATFPRIALDVTHLHSMYDVTIYVIRTKKRITMEFVRPINRDDVEFRTWYIKPREAVNVSIDTNGMFKSKPDIFSVAMHKRMRDKMNDMFAFLIGDKEAVQVAKLWDNRPWGEVRKAAHRKAWIT